ncbi:MAG: histidine phosphatase family protein, partial [Chloroflexi bacterium CFX6]|nr:histidine phosphatase family protein [Chloroflexi bacterium CFX6]
MRTLLVMRHAKSDQHVAGVADHDRPLNARGLATAPRMGAWMAEHGLTPDVILSSTAARARHTAERVAAACGFAGDVVAERGLYDTSPDAYLETVRRLAGDAGTVLLVGHNPTVEALVERLTGSAVAMPTAALAQVDLDLGAGADLRPSSRGRLAGPWRP